MPKIEPVYQYRFAVNPNYAFKYLRCVNSYQFEKNLPDRKGRKKYFTMDKQSIRKIKNCYTWLNLISNIKTVYSKKDNKKFKFKLCFITLTLPSLQKHSDEYIKAHMLEPFLYWMKKYCYCNSYIWKAEVQNNGNIHFHITSNKFIHWKSVRAKWNKICARHNYCKIFQDGSNDKGNASTQIKAVKNNKDLVNYMIKYLCKKETDKRPIEGRLWGASTNLNQSNIVIEDIKYDIQNFQWCLDAIPFVKRITEIKNKITGEMEKINGELFVWSKPIFKYLPRDYRDIFLSRVKELRKLDIPQTLLEIESIYN